MIVECSSTTVATDDTGHQKSVRQKLRNLIRFFWHTRY